MATSVAISRGECGAEVNAPVICMCRLVCVPRSAVEFLLIRRSLLHAPGRAKLFPGPFRVAILQGRVARFVITSAVVPPFAIDVIEK